MKRFQWAIVNDTPNKVVYECFPWQIVQVNNRFILYHFGSTVRMFNSLIRAKRFAEEQEAK